MRIGQNPAKMGLPAYSPKRLGIALLTFIPTQDGYFSQALDILRYQIASIHAATQQFDLLVFDNGSCRDVQEELRRLQSVGLIHFLVLSPYNLGKTGALNWIFAAMPNELICYADSDVLFLAGWFEHSLDILNTFPNAGLVTAQPCLFNALGESEQAIRLLKSQSGIELFEMEIPSSVMEEYVRGIDDGSSEIRERLLKRWQIVRHRETGLETIIGASHMQFLANRENIRSIFPLPVRYGLSREDDNLLHIYADQARLLQLSTRTFLVSHMGNRLDETTLKEIRHNKLDEILGRSSSWKATDISTHIAPAKQRAFRVLTSLSRWRGFRRALQRLYNFIFEFYTALVHE